MAKTSENNQLIQRLAQDDPECLYVNGMMEMSTQFLRNMNKRGDSYESLHGVVPSYNLPIGYSYGNINKMPLSQKMYANKSVINSQNSSNSNSTLRMEVDERDYETIPAESLQMISRDLALSDEDEPNNEESTQMNTNIDVDTRLLFNTLDECSKKIPSLKYMDMFEKHRSTSRNNIKKELPSSNTKLKPQCPNTVTELLDLLSNTTYKQCLASSFQMICDMVNTRNENNKKRKANQAKLDEKVVTPPKMLKLSKMPENKKHTATPDSQYEFHFNKSDMVITFAVLPDLSNDVRDKLKAIMTKSVTEVSREAPVQLNSTKPKYVTQDSLPFVKAESIPKRDPKTIDNNPPSSVSEPLFSKTVTENVQLNPVKKPEAAAKQFLAQSTNYSNYGNNSKVAIVTGKVNKTQTQNWQTKNDTGTDKPIQSLPQKPRQSTQSSRPLTYRDCNDNDADESKVVQGLVAMNKMRNSFKNDFITRMRNLDNDKWLKEVDSLKKKALNCKGQLDYAPQIMIYIRKNLFYNYSLEVKDEFGTSHKTYLDNAAMIKHSCSIITNIYSEHEQQITDPNSSRLWNIKLMKYFTLIMCHRLSAILQYRAFRNVSRDCKKIYETLVQSGVIESDQSNSNHTSSSSPFSVLSSYNNSISSPHTHHRSSPRLCHPGSGVNNNNHHDTVTITGDVKMQLQRYITQTNIINSSYNDWMSAESTLVKYCNRSSRHEECYRDFDRKIIEKTGGVAITTIDESVPFVIKYLEGYINYMIEFMKYSL